MVFNDSQSFSPVIHLPASRKEAALRWAYQLALRTRLRNFTVSSFWNTLAELHLAATFSCHLAAREPGKDRCSLKKPCSLLTFWRFAPREKRYHGYGECPLSNE